MSTTTAGAPRASSRSYVLGLLTLVYAFNFVDRQILGILAPFIAADLGFDDSQIGLLTGFYFALFYTVLGIPIAAYADRGPRVLIVSAALAVWSGFTFASGFVTSFFWLALARIGVAVGEAGGSPPSHSVLSDLYRPKERGRALAIYSLGIPFGTMAAYFAVAALAGEDDAPWRLVLFVIGAPGVILAAIIALTVKEPRRGQLERAVSAPGVPFGAALRRLLRIPSYWLMCLGISFASFGGYAIAAFLVTYITRAFPDVPVPPMLVTLGVINGVSYAAGTYLGGQVADRWAERDVRGYALAPARGTAVAGVAAVAALYVESYGVFIALVTAFTFFAGLYLGPSFSVAQNLAPVEVRATSTAVFFFVLNLIALGGGSTVVGFASTALTEAHGAEVGLRYALSLVGITYALAVVCYLATAVTLRKDWARAQGENADTTFD